MKAFILILLIVAPKPSFATADADRAQEIIDIQTEAEFLTERENKVTYHTLAEFVDHYSLQRNEDAEQNLGENLLRKIYSDYIYDYESLLIASGQHDPMIFFITYDYGTTVGLGAGERAGVISSWRSAQLARSAGVFIPTRQFEWEDIIKIANGRWPSSLRNEIYEQNIEKRFQEVYLRAPNRTNPNDDAAVMIMAYGLRPEPRNVGSERQAIGFFKSIYQRDPNSASDWDIVRAIAYSGAIR